MGKISHLNTRKFLLLGFVGFFLSLPVPGFSIDLSKLSSNSSWSLGIQAENRHVLKGETLPGDIISTGAITVEGTVTGDCLAFGNSLDLSGEVKGDVAVFGAPCRLSGRVEGDVACLGGPLSLSGTVKGDVASFGGDVTLGPQAVVTGSLLLAGGHLTKADGAAVKGTIQVTDGKTQPVDSHLLKTFLPLTKSHPFLSTVTSHLVGLPPNANSSYSMTSRSWDWNASRIFDFFRWGSLLIHEAFLIGMGFLIFLLTALLPKQVGNMAGAIQTNFWKSGGVGLLISILFFPGLLLMVISIVGIFLIPPALLLFSVAGLMGTAAFSLVLAQRLFESLKKPVPAVILSVLLGYFLVNLLMVCGKLLETTGNFGSSLGEPLAFASWALLACGSMVGLGAAWKTRLGSRALETGSGENPGSDSF